MFKKYREYMKDDPRGYWFKRKLYGWGWTPVKWQGWVVILAFVASIVWNALGLSLDNMDGNLPGSKVAWFAAKIAVSVAVLIFICYKKGEKPRWQWGHPKKDDEIK